MPNARREANKKRLAKEGLPIQRALYERLDGLLLPGGGDVDPAWYGETARPDCEVDGVDRLRDRVEMELARWALADERPLLGICRGQQTLNVAAGATPAGPRCSVTVGPGSWRGICKPPPGPAWPPAGGIGVAGLPWSPA